jgi:hypothetical protein
MSSLYLSRLSKDERKKLEKQLWEQQRGKCFISEETIDLGLQEVDIDHDIPTRDNGKDDPSNFALTLSHYNRSKLAADLRIARILARFEKIKRTADSDDRGTNLNDVLKAFGGGTSELRIKIENGVVSYVAEAMNGSTPQTVPLCEGKLSGFRYFFALLPIDVIHHDERINPRPIGSNIRGLVEEFFKKRPQLHVSLAWIETSNLPTVKVRVFDGQHKAAAQILLGVRRIPLRIFVDPDEELLLTANTNAGTTLRQVAFDKSVQRRLGSSILLDRIAHFREERVLRRITRSFLKKRSSSISKGSSVRWRVTCLMECGIA